MKEFTCCFTGHREIAENEIKAIWEKTERKVLELFEKGVTVFEAGGALGYDTLAAEVVLSLREKYPQIKLRLILPCKDQARGWTTEDIIRYEGIKDMADEVIYTAETYYRGCMFVRNRRLVDDSAYCICFKKRASGGTAYTVDYALKKGLTVFNVVYG